MNRRLTTVAAASLALVALTLGSSALAAARTSSYIIRGATSIDGYRVGATYAQAQRFLGGSYSTSQSNTTCTARWKNGVTIVWHRKLPATKWAKACTRFNSARVGRAKKTRATWQTGKGLRVGASQAQLKKLYPGATSKGSNRYKVWTLAKASKISLQAWVTNGQVAFFRLVRG
jgi:hypothetical protein